MKDIMGVMKKVEQLQARMKDMQEELARQQFEGQSGGGLVKVTMSGKGEIAKVHIDPSILKPEEAEIVEDLIVAAATDAKSKADQHMQAKMAEATAGLPIPPGMKLF